MLPLVIYSSFCSLQPAQFNPIQSNPIQFSYPSLTHSIYLPFISVPQTPRYNVKVFYEMFLFSVKKVKVKVKCTLVQALRLCTGRTAHKGRRVIALLFHDHGTRRG